LLRGNNGCCLKDRAKHNIFALARACFGAQETLQEDTPMQRAFSIPHVPVAISDYSFAPRRMDVREIMRNAGDHCLFLLRRFADFMASGGALS
jgi:hypothetical protein